MSEYVNTMKLLGSKTLETDRLILKAQTMEEQQYQIYQQLFLYQQREVRYLCRIIQRL